MCLSQANWACHRSYSYEHYERRLLNELGWRAVGLTKILNYTTSEIRTDGDASTSCSLSVIKTVSGDNGDTACNRCKMIHQRATPRLSTDSTDEITSRPARPASGCADEVERQYRLRCGPRYLDRRMGSAL